jgi:hypothetical protein
MVVWNGRKVSGGGRRREAGKALEEEVDGREEWAQAGYTRP